MKRTLQLTAISLFAATCASATTLFLPAPSGSSTIVAAWVPTNAQIIDDQGTDKLSYTGPWVDFTAANSPVAARYASGGDFNFTASVYSGTSLPSSIYTMNTRNISYNVGTTNYSGSPFTQITLQLAMNSYSANDTLESLSPVLNIGDKSFAASMNGFSSNLNFQPEGFRNDPTNRYYGHFMDLALVSVTWDLEALGYTGDLSTFDIDWVLAPSHSSLYDVQISVNAVPEPTTVATLLGAAALLWVAVRRRRAA